MSVERNDYATPARPLAVSRFDDCHDSRPNGRKSGWAILQRTLTRHTARAVKDGPCWSPVRYRAGATRSRAGVETVSCFVADIDDGTPPSALVGRWRTPEGAPLAFCLHSSHTSTGGARSGASCSL